MNEVLLSLSQAMWPPPYATGGAISKSWRIAVISAVGSRATRRCFSLRKASNRVLRAQRRPTATRCGQSRKTTFLPSTRPRKPLLFQRACFPPTSSCGHVGAASACNAKSVQPCSMSKSPTPTTMNDRAANRARSSAQHHRERSDQRHRESRAAFGNCPEYVAATRAHV